MLLNLNICNFAVFENESIKFEEGFNVFTGETGAGKSILIDALFIVLGERASKDLIRKGKKSAIIEAVFDISNNLNLLKFLEDNNIFIDEGDFLIISREILENGKSINKVNSRVVSLSIIKSIGNFLIDIYGQFGNTNLFKKENHIMLLDSLIQKEIEPLLEEYTELYKRYDKINNEIDFFEKKLVNKDMRIDQLQYELNEIEEANLNENEEEKLLKEIKRLSNIQEIKKSFYDINNIVSANDNSIINNLNNVYSILNKLSNYDDNINDYLHKLDILLEEMQEFLYDIINYSDNLDLDEEKLLLIENRVSLINRLKRKYGYSIEKIMEYQKNSYDELQVLQELESNLKSLKKEKKNKYEKLIILGEKVSNERKKAASFLEKELVKELYDLDMKNIKFKVSIHRKQDFSLDGIDSVEFLIATNVGNDLSPVQKIVSGGEASRIMLAFKKIISESDNIDTLVFDEIDSGISGKTAQMAGVKMKFISKSHQIVCVTHSPQIASISENHFYIKKSVIGNKTYSSVNKLGSELRVKEIARLLSGIKITEKSLNNAKELIEFSNNI
ncbi:MAG: DNA repair protein RecN [Tissierellia bacterium]|nr:DNA repair protein RecN [Tissierellia bacterium]